MINSLNNTNQSSMFQCFVFSISPQTYSSGKNIKIFAKMKLKICFSIWSQVYSEIFCIKVGFFHCRLDSILCILIFLLVEVWIVKFVSGMLKHHAALEYLTSVIILDRPNVIYMFFFLNMSISEATLFNLLHLFHR